MLKYLLDEHIAAAYQERLQQIDPTLSIKKIGDLDTLKFGTLDPQVLLWCEAHDFVLVTNNRKSMPLHLSDHLTGEHHIPGIFIINLEAGVSDNAEALYLIAITAITNEYRDQIIYVPFW